MLYTIVKNEWDEITYVPTMLGNILLVAAICLLLLLAIVVAKKRKTTSSKGMTAKQLIFSAMAIALGTVLSNIKLFTFPTGGSVTLISMLIICLPGYWFGMGAGLLTGVAYGVLQLLIDPYVLYPMQLVVDYLLAFGALGLSGLFCNAKNGLLKGYIAGVLGRYFFAVLSGWIFFGLYAWEGWNPFLYSVVYNAIYIFAEAAVTIVLLSIKPVQKAFAGVKRLAAE